MRKLDDLIKKINDNRIDIVTYITQYINETKKKRNQILYG